MDIVLQASNKPPEKRYWADPDPKSRAEWSDIYETIGYWFCTSHDFNSDNNLTIQLENGSIVFNGENLRYLGPSLRSAASLVSKAYNKLKSNVERPVESTPGVVVYPSEHDFRWKQPYYQLVLSDKTSNTGVQDGTIFTFDYDLAQTYYAPARRISQATVWILQRRK